AGRARRVHADAVGAREIRIAGRVRVTRAADVADDSVARPTARRRAPAAGAAARAAPRAAPGRRAAARAAEAGGAVGPLAAESVAARLIVARRTVVIALLSQDPARHHGAASDEVILRTGAHDRSSLGHAPRSCGVVLVGREARVRIALLSCEHQRTA